MKIDQGQIWQAIDHEDLYMVGSIDIANCSYITSVNLSTGLIGPLWEDDYFFRTQCRFLCDSIEDLAKKPTESMR